tara:strand:- start:79 stop:483 length:405 start_codon:yes stop_codon:yes gene_type:complete
MSPTNRFTTSAIINSNTPGIEYRIIDSHDITNTQIIVSKTIRGERYSYNFNGDVEDATMELTYGMNKLFDLPIGSYKRTISPDCSYINIFPSDESETSVPETREAWPVNNDSNSNSSHNSQVIRTNDVFAIVEN